MIETVEAPAPVEPTTPLKPSEAMRLGQMLVPQQARASMFECTKGGEIVAACALGALYIGYYGDGPIADVSLDADMSRYHKLYNLYDDVQVPCPGRAAGITGPVLRWVPYLNDAMRWDVGRIADWLEGLGL